MTRLLVVEDEPLVRGGIMMLLSGHPDLEVVGEAEDGISGLRLAEELAPDVVILDLRMPGLDGVEVTRRLVSQLPVDDRLVKVLVLTTFNTDEDVYGALRAGASGFLLKESASARLVDAVRAIAAGDSWVDPSVTAQLLRVLQEVPHDGAWAPGVVDRLSSREQEVLTLMAHGLSNAEISQRFVISETTVKTHVHRILMKTACRDRSQAVVLAYRSGFVASSSVTP